VNNFISIIMLAVIFAVGITYTLRAFRQQKKREVKVHLLFMLMGSFLGILMSPRVATVIDKTYSVVEEASIGILFLSALSMSVLGALSSLIIYSCIKSRDKN